MLELLTLSLVTVVIGQGYWLYRQRQRLLAHQQQAADHEKTISSLRADINTRDKTLQDCKTETIRLDALILKLRQAVAAHESTIGELQKHLVQYQSIITNLRGQIETREQQSRESKALFSTISNVAYDLVFVLNEDRIVIALNQAADALFGRKNPIGEKIRDVINVPELDEIVDRAMTEPESLEEQLVVDNRYYRVRTQVIRYEGQHTFIGVAMQDITDLVRLNRARRDMVANISHELRTPIANIRLIIDGLFYDKDRPKRKASIASLRSIARETDYLLHLVQELLDLSMIESGQAILKMVPIYLIDVVGSAVERLRDQFDHKYLKPVIHVPEKLVVLCDFDQTRRVFTNLLRNAIKWSPAGESIIITAKTDGDEATLYIFDNGPGVPEDQKERIFERFYQVDPARTGREGSGLGLAICKHIVEAHGGRIWAESNVTGSGGRFFFTLLDAGTEIPAPSLPAPGQHDSGLNMLLAARYSQEMLNEPFLANGLDVDGEIELED
jgi:two-component system phosphate regulon sensor histidine kinase PhoR